MPEKDTSDPTSPPKEQQGTQTAEPPKAAPKKSAKPRRKTKQLPPFNVVLLDDDDHTYEYVIEMLGQVFGYAKEQAFKLAEEVDGSGRVIVLTTHKELAELKRDQILAYGRDSRISACRGSMTAIIEPAGG
jgi:ATP-dependent Clp protease adaptor protein ClpS